MEWVNDPENRMFVGRRTPINSFQEDKWFEKIGEKKIVLSIKHKKTKKIIGNVSMMDIETENRCAELGVLLGDKTFQNKGLGTEVEKLMLKYAFNTLNLHRIEAYIYTTNTRSLKVAKRVGFKQEGILREREYLNGKYEDCIALGILKKEFKP